MEDCRSCAYDGGSTVVTENATTITHEISLSRGFIANVIIPNLPNKSRKKFGKGLRRYEVKLKLFKS